MACSPHHAAERSIDRHVEAGPSADFHVLRWPVTTLKNEAAGTGAGRGHGTYSRSSSRSVQSCPRRSPTSGSSSPILVRSETGVPSSAVGQGIRIAHAEAYVLRRIVADVVHRCRECRVARLECREHLRVRLFTRNQAHFSREPRRPTFSTWSYLSCYPTCFMAPPPHRSAACCANRRQPPNKPTSHTRSF